MTVALSAQEVGERLEKDLPGAGASWQMDQLQVRPEAVREVCRWLKVESGLELDYLVAITAVDFVDHFEVVYHLASIGRNHSLVLKTKVFGRETPAVPSVVEVWQGADLQEREVWDLMGVRFEGHPNLKRILTWEEFPGHPLRKDFQGA